ncbi:MAG: HAD family phosphatase [Methanophagales archaeon]|nr:HAD family phosphatase [Methanophagales archaeon]
MLKAVIFDLDGVLSDSVERDIAITVAAYKKFGYSILKSDEQFIIGRHPADRVAFFAEEFDIPEKKQRLIVEEEKRLYRELWDTTSKLFPGVKETLDAVKNKGMILALATTSTRDSVKRFIQRFRLEGYFKVVLTREDVSERKPNPEIYIKAKNELGYNLDEIIVVEDTEIGVIAAKSAGLMCVAIPNQYTKKQDFSNADYVLESIGVLCKMF